LTDALFYVKLHTTRKGVIKINARINFVLPDDLVDRVKKIAKQEGKTMTAIVNELLSGYVGSESEIEKIKERLDKLEKEVFGKQNKPKKDEKK